MTDWSQFTPVSQPEPDPKPRLRYDAPELDAYADEIEQKYQLPTGLVKAIKNHGERSNSWQVSPVGARGVMQFMPQNLAKYGVTDPEDPYQMIDAAGRYLRDTSKQYGGNVQAMIADYNGGPRQAKRVLRGERPAAPETNAYLTRVMAGLGIGTANASEGPPPLPSSQPAVDWSQFEPVDSAPAAVQTTGEMRAYEPTLWDTIKNAGSTLIGQNEGSVERPLIDRIQDAGGQLVDAITPDSIQRGVRSGKQTANILLNETGVLPKSVYGPQSDQYESAAFIADLERQKGQFPKSPEVAAAQQGMTEAGSVGEWFDAATPGAVVDVLGESFGQALPQVAATAVGGPVSMAANLFGGFGTEYGSTIMQSMQQAGVNVEDPGSIADFMSDPAKLAQAKQDAVERGVPIAIFDAVTAGIAGKFFRGTGLGKVAARTLTDAGLGVGGGMGGETAAQLADKGEVTSLGDILTEGVAEGPSTVVEGIGNVMAARKPSVGAPAPSVDSAQVNWDEYESIAAPQQEIAQPAPQQASSPETAETTTPATPVEASPQAVAAPPADLPAEAGTTTEAATAEPAAPQETAPEAAPAAEPAAAEAPAPVRRAEEVEAARITELRTKRRVEPLTPLESDELVTLMERDAHAAKVAGRRIQGVQNMAARNELESTGQLKPIQAFADADDFKSFNDQMGHDVGDSVIRTLGQEFHAALGDGNVFHRGGDEFVLQADTPEAMAAAMESVRSKLSQAEFVMTTADGQTIVRKGVGFSYGTGATTQEAEHAQSQDKSARKAAGLRTGARDATADPNGADSRNGAVDRQESGEGGAADAGRSSQTVAPQEGVDVARNTVAGTGPVAPEGQPAGTERSVGEDQAAVQSQDRGAEDVPAAAQGAETDAPRAAARVTGVKNAVTDAEREGEGRPAREKSAPKSNKVSIEEARAEIEKNPGIGRDVVARLKNAGVDGISTRDEAILMAHKVSIRSERDAASERATDESLSAEERDAARRTHEELSLEIAEIDQAAYNSGREWGRFGQLRQRLMRDDFSLESMERKARMARNRPLTPEELSEVKRQAAQIKTLQDQLDASQKAIDDAKAGEGVKVTYAQMVRDLALELSGKTTEAKAERPTLEKLKQGADESRAALRKMMGGTQFNSGFDPTILYHLGRIGAYHIANGVVKLAEWVAKMRADLGAQLFKEVEPALEELHAQLKKAGGNPVAKPGDVLEAIDPQNLRARDVADLARAHILAGTHSEGPVMKAVHADLKKLIPDITEREVRRAFTDYGKAILPSKAADKVELRELRRLVQLQESIDRLREGLAPLKSGPQRDKATQAIREKLAQLNDLLKQAETKYKDSPEKLASYQSARKTALENGIADLEKQIANGEKTQRAPRPELNEENKKLAEKRDALRKQLEALERTKNVDKITAERKKAVEEQIEKLKRHIAGTEPKPAPKEKLLDPPELHELKVLRDDLRKQLKAIESPPKSPEQRYQDTREKQLKRMLDNVSERLATDNYERSHRSEPRALSQKNQDIAFELREKKQDFLRKQFEYELGNRSPIRKVFGAVQETFNLARAIMTSLDLSAVLRQGGFIAAGHPLRALRAVPDMLRAFASEKAAFAVEDEISKRENAPLYSKYKLELTDRHSTSLSKMEEAFMSRLVDKLPRAIGGGLVRGSSRAYSTFLNKLRADSFDAMTAALGRGKQPTEAEGKAVANFINAATGRGSLGKFQQSASVLNTVFFAPRWVSSRFQMLAGQPLYGGTMGTRMMIAKEYARYLMGTAVMMSLVSLALGDDDDDGIMSDDPRSTDFMKIRIGDTVIDPWAGLIQPTVLLSRIATREKVTASGKVQPLDGKGFNEDVYDVLTRFLRTKLAPVPGGLVTLASGSNVIGEEQSPLEVWSSMVVPLSLQDIAPIMEDAGVPRGTAITLLSTLGMGVQYRDPAGINKTDKGVESAGSRGSGRGSVRKDDKRGSTR